MSEDVPWILKHAAERRREVADPIGHVDDADLDGVPAEEAPVSKFRRVSGAPATPAAAAPIRPAATRAYTPPSPPSPRDWDDEVDAFHRAPQAYAPPPSRPAPPPSSPGYSPYAPTPARRRMGSGVIAAVVAGVLVVGGGVGGVLLVKGGAPSRAEFVAKADDVCRPANGPVAAIVKPTSYPELATAAGTLNTIIDAQLGQLRALKQPGGSAKADVAGVFTSLEGTSAAAKQLQEAAGRHDDAATIAATKDMANAAGEARTRATTAGFGACSVGLQTGVDAVYGGTQSVMKAGFVAQADVLCRRAAADIFDVDLDFDFEDESAFVDYVAFANGVFDHLVSDIKALPVPPGDETTLTELFTAQDKVQAKNREFEDAAGDEDFDRMDAVDRELTTLITAADAKWDAYGLGSCGSNFGS